MKSADPSFEWKMPISFYGRVIDQAGKPVLNAQVRFQWTDLSASGTTERFSQSDENGYFSLTGESGKRLGVWVSKDGYHSEGGLGGKSFEYAAFFEGNFHRPNIDDPVTFRLVKKLDPEPLVVRHISKRTTYDRATYYDIERGELTRDAPPGGALKIEFERSESPQGQAFDWTWKVEAVNGGGLQEAKDEIVQMAPEDNYLPAWRMSLSANAQDFRKSGRARFYIRTSDNRFAWVGLELGHPNLRSVGPKLTVDSYMNPSGSRNLEYDPTKQDSAN